jgi:hypothetical protein
MCSEPANSFARVRKDLAGRKKLFHGPKVYCPIHRRYLATYEKPGTHADGRTTRLKRQHLALKEQRLARRIFGVRSGPSSERARECGIDSGAANPVEAVRDGDLVVLATPVISILDPIDRLGPALPPKTLMTDLDSTKAIIDRTAKTFGRNAAQKFVAGHPMARKGKLWRESC